MSELDWSQLTEIGEIYLIVCRPIQREIDNLKNKGNDRVGRRARHASSLFRKLITNNQEFKLVREANPQVKLFIESSCLPSPSLEKLLDYGNTDDELVGCVHSYKERNPDIDVRLLTHDCGPMGTASMLSIPFVPIPDDWVSPPEKSRTEQENEKLRNELALLKKTEPDFEINFVNSSQKELDLLEFEQIKYEPLTNDEISELMSLLEKKYPIATEFGPPEQTEQNVQDSNSKLLSLNKVFTPASDQEISEYTDSMYPAWIETCEKILRNLHTLLERNSEPINFIVSAVNKGTRPGENTLVTISAKGNFKIQPPREEGMDEK